MFDINKLNDAIPAIGGYYSLKFLSNSLLDYVLPLVEGKEVKKKVTTPQMVFGTVLHTALLEPHKFVAAVCSSSDLLLINRIKRSFEENEQVTRILYRSIKEVEYFFNVRKIPAKLKADAIDISAQHLYDIKTISDIANIEKSIVNYNYDRQMAFYLDALNLHKATLIFVCKKTFAIEIYPLSEKQVQEGRNKYNYLLDLIEKHDLLEKLYEI